MEEDDMTPEQVRDIVWNSPSPIKNAKGVNLSYGNAFALIASKLDKDLSIDSTDLNVDQQDLAADKPATP